MRFVAVDDVSERQAEMIDKGELEHTDFSYDISPAGIRVRRPGSGLPGHPAFSRNSAAARQLGKARVIFSRFCPRFQKLFSFRGARRHVDSRSMRTFTSLLAINLAALLVTGVAAQKPTPKPTAEPPAVATAVSPTATVQEIMATIIDPASKVVFGAVSTTESNGVEQKKEPRNDEEWA